MMFVVSVMHVVGGVPLWLDVCFIVQMACVCVCCAPSCYSECGVLCYL